MSPHPYGVALYHLEYQRIVTLPFPGEPNCKVVFLDNLDEDGVDTWQSIECKSGRQWDIHAVREDGELSVTAYPSYQGETLVNFPYPLELIVV